MRGLRWGTFPDCFPFSASFRHRLLGRSGWSDAREVGRAPVELGKLSSAELGEGDPKAVSIPGLACSRTRSVHSGGAAGRGGCLPDPRCVTRLAWSGFREPAADWCRRAAQGPCVIPDFIEVVQRILPSRVGTEYEGIPSATVAQALIDCRGTPGRFSQRVCWNWLWVWRSSVPASAAISSRAGRRACWIRAW